MIVSRCLRDFIRSIDLKSSVVPESEILLPERNRRSTVSEFECVSADAINLSSIFAIRLKLQKSFIRSNGFVRGSFRESARDSKWFRPFAS